MGKIFLPSYQRRSIGQSRKDLIPPTPSGRSAVDCRCFLGVVTMYQRLVVGVLPEERITRTIHCNDVINVSIRDGACLPTSTSADAMYTEVLLPVLLPLVSIATLGSAGSTLIITPILWTWQRWLLSTRRAASTRTDQDPWMTLAWTLWLIRHYSLKWKLLMPSVRV